MRVVVVGAGIGGLAAAIAAVRAGHDVTVLERDHTVRMDGVGIGMLPNAITALDQLGLGEPLRTMASRVGGGGGIFDRHRRPLIIASQRAIESITNARAIAVDRGWLHRMLAAELPDGTIRPGSEVRAVQTSGSTARVLIKGAHSEVADLAIVADGARSRMRSNVAPDNPELVPVGNHAARGIAASLPYGMSPLGGELLDHRTGERTGSLPMADGGVYWWATWRESIVGRVPRDPATRQLWLARRRSDWHPHASALIRATPAEKIQVVSVEALAKPLPTFVFGRAVLLGDAAHAMTPDLGQGGCQALEDAAVLRSVLDGATTDTLLPALAAYDEKRRQRTQRLLRDSWRMNRLLGLHGIPARARDAALRLVPPSVATRTLIRQYGFDPTLLKAHL